MGHPTFHPFTFLLFGLSSPNLLMSLTLRLSRTYLRMRIKVDFKSPYFLCQDGTRF